jgi:hypothetical protein
MPRRVRAALIAGAALLLLACVAVGALGLVLLPCDQREGDLYVSQPADQARAALHGAGIAGATVSASSSGVACVNRVGQVRSYTLRDTSLSLSVPAGEALARVLDALDLVPAEAKLARTHVTARDGAIERRLRPFSPADGRQARQQGLRGAALVEALDRPR